MLALINDAIWRHYVTMCYFHFLGVLATRNLLNIGLEIIVVLKALPDFHAYLTPLGGAMQEYVANIRR